MEIVNKNKLIEVHRSKLFSKSKDNSNGNNFDLDTDLSTLKSKLADEAINSCSNILDSTDRKTIDCGSNLSTPQISEEYDQGINLKKKLEEQQADVRKQLSDNYNSFK